MIKTNRKGINNIIKVSLALISVTLIASCATENPRFFRGDVIGFSDNVKTSYTTESRGLFMNLKDQSDPFNLLGDEGKREMKTSIDRVPRGENTTAYYAMELAAMRVKYIRKKVAKRDPKTKYYIFLLTDGLDNASPQVAKSDGRTLFTISPEKYQKRLQKKMKRAMGFWSKNTFEVYPLVYEGEDMQESKKMNNLTDREYEAKLREWMACFRYSSNGEAPEMISASSFETIIESLKERLVENSYTFKVPKSYSGKKIRMEFRNGSGTLETTLTADLKKSLGKYYLENIQLTKGATISTYGRIASESDFPDNVNAYFTIKDFKLNGKAYQPKNSNITQDYEAQSGYWQRNSEYSEVQNKSINTYFILVIDGSRSLDGKNHDKNGFALV